MSAMTGNGEPLTISFKASAASRSGTAGRTISQPTSFSSWIWRSVALTSRVSVLVMVCTARGAAPPMTTPPTLTGIDLRLTTISGALRSGPLMTPGKLAGGDALDIQEADHSGEGEQRGRAPALEVELALAVERPAAEPLDEDDDDAPAIECWNRKQVGEAQRHREQSHQQQVVWRALDRKST